MAGLLYWGDNCTRTSKIFLFRPKGGKTRLYKCSKKHCRCLTSGHDNSCQMLDDESSATAPGQSILYLDETPRNLSGWNVELWKHVSFLRVLKKCSNFLKNIIYLLIFYLVLSFVYESLIFSELAAHHRDHPAVRECCCAVMTIVTHDIWALHFFIRLSTCHVTSSMLQPSSKKLDAPSKRR